VWTGQDRTAIENGNTDLHVEFEDGWMDGWCRRWSEGGTEWFVDD
jgi:hypothetical protein